MFKSIRRFAFTVLIAHWMYAEANLIWPHARPMIDAAISTIQIPTHDTWKEKWNAFNQARRKMVLKAGPEGNS